MKNFEEYFKLNEDLENDLKDKLSDEYKPLKRAILTMIEKSVDEPEKLLNVQNYMDEYVDNEDTILEEFVENADIYDFYLKHQTDIDDLLNDNEWFDKPPLEHNISSLFDYTVTGTKEAVKICIQEMYEELFGTEE